MQELRHSLSFWSVTAIGIGSVVGCGIFLLFSHIFAKAGPLTAVAFLLAAVPNLLAGLSYAELAGLYDSDTVEYDSIKDAFGEMMGKVSIYVLLLFLVFNVTTILLSVPHLLGFPELTFEISILILAVMSIVNYTGIDVSKKITNTMSIVEICVLLVIILASMRSDWQFIPMTKSQGGTSLWLASFLAIFLYTGYDNIVKLTEETKDSANVIPKSVIATIVITSVIYVAVGLIAVNLPKWGDHGSDSLPISFMYESIFGKGPYLKVLHIITIFIVVNAFFACLIGLSRLIYGLGKRQILPEELSAINERFDTPHNAILITFILIAITAFVDNLEKCATYSNIFFLIFLCMMNITVIVLRMKKPDAYRSFRIPLNIGVVPIPVVLGIVTFIAYIAIAVCNFDKLG